MTLGILSLEEDQKIWKEIVEGELKNLRLSQENVHNKWRRQFGCCMSAVDTWVLCMCL